MDEIEKAKEKEKTRILKLVAKKEMRVSMSEEVMRKNLEIKKADRQAKAQLMAKEEYSGLLSEKQVTNKLCMEIKEQLCGGVLGYNVHVTEDEDLSRSPVIENESREVRYVSDDKIKSDIFNHFEAISKFDTRYLWSHREAENIYKMWLCSAPLTDIKKISWLSEPGVAFRRLPFDHIKKDSYTHPTWSKIIESIQSGSHQFMYFIGSIFEPRSPQQNYMWMYGSGRNAKGTILRVLKELLGGAAKSQDAPTEQTKRFWTNSLRGKRLVYIPDVTEFGFIKTGFWKKLTGGDEINVERKGGDHYDLANEIKAIVDSNDKPAISSKRSDLRRIVFVEFKEMAEDIEKIEEKLTRELPEFISHCYHFYLDKYAPNFPAIECEHEEVVKDLAEENEDHFAYVWEKYAVKEPGSRIKTSEIAGICSIERMSSRQAADFKSWTRRVPLVNQTSKNTTENGIQYRYYEGFKFVDPALSRMNAFVKFAQRG